MMDSNQVVQLKNVFDQIVHITEDGIEFWYARELQSALGYTRWENFVNAIEKAKVSCASSGRDVDGCFRDVTKTSPMPNGGTKDIADVMLIALQTRKQELLEQRISDLNRVQQRQQLRTSEKRLSQNIYERGVDDRGFARIRSKGDSALFGGRTTEEMKMQYGVKSGPLADVLPPVTLAAKNLATEMTNLNVEQKDLQGESSITHEHVQNNSSVRSMLLGRDIRPEDLPPEEDIKKLERRLKSEEKKLAKGKDVLK